jgi:hypothetical protein
MASTPFLPSFLLGGLAVNGDGAVSIKAITVFSSRIARTRGLGRIVEGSDSCGRFCDETQTA